MKVLKALRDIDDIMAFDSYIEKSESHQSISIPATMVEALNVDLEFEMEGSLDELRKHERLNLQWCDEHFNERVNGFPTNPGNAYKIWPWSKYAEDHKEEMFNHNYMERYWPRKAGILKQPTNFPQDFRKLVPVEHNGLEISDIPVRQGIRGEYGDLNNLIFLLQDEPSTRQAYLPIFFPEDTGNANPGRKPCTLGYHFIIRKNKLHVNYYIRSCDYYRHFIDDVYLTVKLAEYVAWRLDNKFELGNMKMVITSLHMFLSDYQLHFKQQHGDLLW